jgi:protocatechuate 3,4-dioxygenase alpha subunit
MSLPVTPSQTVGPFFGVGLPYENSEQAVTPGRAGAIRLEGQVVDGHGDPVPDALLEVWEPTVGFGRCRTDAEGAFHFIVARPIPVSSADEARPAPYLNLTVFARGLLRHLITRMYFPDETANADDPVLNAVEPGRRQTLIAKFVTRPFHAGSAESGTMLYFDIRLQGENETVFFAI